MAFSGENTVVGTTAHLHTNTAGDGGSLDTTTLINSGSLFTMMVALG
jgi:hypothetical protein